MRADALPSPLQEYGERIEARICPAPADRGTEPAVRFKQPPSDLARSVPARLAGQDPGQELRRALREADHGRRYIPMLLERLAAGEPSTANLATHTLSPDEAPRAYDMFKQKSDGCVGAVVRTGG
ncbi:hypothetical protein [Streptomyces canus]|uniref:hypothetical protein n=1 Tax=Streptomyces canus TaxID=58343 RepID=UPI0033B1D787